MKLKLNPDKNEFITAGVTDTKVSCSISSKLYHASRGSKNLGVTFDSEKTFDSHLGKVYRACYYLRDLRCICKFLTVDNAVLVAITKMHSSRLSSRLYLFQI